MLEIFPLPLGDRRHWKMPSGNLRPTSWAFDFSGSQHGS